MLIKLLSFAAISAGIYLLVAAGLILSQPTPELRPRSGLDFDRLLDDPRFEPPHGDDRFQRSKFTGADDTPLDMTHVVEASRHPLPLIVMVHGSSTHGGQFDKLAWNLRDVAEVKAVTLRGHGADPQRRGDIDYVGQFEDDLAALLSEEDGSRPVVMLGHSSGGGLVVRFAGGEHGGLIDGAILLAPFLKYNAPTTRQDAGGWARPLTRRIIGLSMLNQVGMSWLNHLTVLQFHIPRDVLEGPQGAMTTAAYSYRLNTSFAPRADFLEDIAKLPKFLLVAGREDEAFRAEKYEPTMAAVTERGRYVLLEGIGHLDVVNTAATETHIREFLIDL